MGIERESSYFEKFKSFGSKLLPLGLTFFPQVSAFKSPFCFSTPNSDRYNLFCEPGFGWIAELIKQCGISSNVTCSEIPGAILLEFGKGLFLGSRCDLYYSTNTSLNNCVDQTLKNNTPTGFGTNDDTFIAMGITCGGILVAGFTILAVGYGIDRLCCQYRKSTDSDELEGAANLLSSEDADAVPLDTLPAKKQETTTVVPLGETDQLNKQGTTTYTLGSS